MISLNDVVEANKLLMTMGGDDQLPRIASAAIERSLELQHRVDRALAYAAETPPNSMHARQMARILDGSITIDDELNEIDEHRLPEPRRLPVAEPAEPAEPKRRGPGKKTLGRPGSRNSGLAGRSTKQRKAFREWADAQGYAVPRNGPVPPHMVEAYDAAMEEDRRARAAERQAQRRGLVLQGEERPEAAGGEPQLFAEHG